MSTQNAFNMQQAISLCTANLASRTKKAVASYRLYYSNDGNSREFITGTTIKALINEFRETRGTYKYAVITKAGDFKPLRFYNRDEGKKFFSMTRTGKRAKQN